MVARAVKGPPCKVDLAALPRCRETVMCGDSEARQQGYGLTRCFKVAG